MNRTAETYVDLRGRSIDVSTLDAEERKLVGELLKRAKAARESSEFRNCWMPLLSELYAPRGLSRREIAATPLWRIAQDLASRWGIKEGWMRGPDYRDQLQELIQERFPTQRSFAEATGIAEDLLSHVLARRKHLSIETLDEGLRRIGCELRIVPMEQRVG